jgi:hypothetical protein
MTKADLINELLHKPLSFSDAMLNDLVKQGLNFEDIRECIRRIYDLSEEQLTETSNANTGMMGKLNRRSTSKRIRLFNNKIKKLKDGDSPKIIYAEGDSWFQFPVFIRDIIDWLTRREGYIVYSDAYGGDWITNIIYESQYVSALSLLRPGYFLISGGGNDLVGNNRLAIMVKKGNHYPKYTDSKPLADPELTDYHKDLIMMAQDHITKEFYAFLWAIKAQYLLLFRQLYAENSTRRDIVTITQGYDYAIPSFGKSWSLRYPLKKLVNIVLDNGCWLMRPLRIGGILDETLQKALVMTFIYEFNQIFVDIARMSEFGNVYHVDCRNLAFSDKCWYDELHYRRHVYKIVARAYSHIIENHGNCEKVVRVIDFREKTFNNNRERLLFNQTHQDPMFYLVIRNMGNERCIHKNKNNIYTSGKSFNCLNSLSFNKTNHIGKVQISCVEDPSSTMEATIYSD